MKYKGQTIISMNDDGMIQNDISGLILKREQWVKSSNENDFYFDNILAGIYNDPSHFIYEILQNAEDAGATEIEFKLFPDRFEIYHNGKIFDFKDVEGITGIGISTKKEDINTIGKFGVGFKSVFAITSNPVIHSGKYHFKINDFVIPHELPFKEVKGTVILLPFNHPVRNPISAYDIVAKKLETLELKSLLFLSSITRLKWETHIKSAEYFRTSKKKYKVEGVKETMIVFKSGSLKIKDRYLVLEKPVRIDNNNLKVEIAYRIIKSKDRTTSIVQETDTRLVAYFPTEKVTNLAFLIQGPFKTTPNRENIPLEDSQNKVLIRSTAQLVADSIEKIKELGLLNVQFLETLPIEQSHLNEVIYFEIHAAVKDKLLGNIALLPKHKNGYTTANNALMARGRELPDLLNSSDLRILFKRTNWLDTKITADKTRQLREYLINELKIKEVDFEIFAANLTIEFLLRKPDAWIIKFYKSLLSQKSLWEKVSYLNRRGGILRRKPIIRLSDRMHIEPFNKDGSIQVYLPGTNKSKYKTVHEALVKNENALRFLTELGVAEPNLLSEIKELLIPKYSQAEINVSYEEHYEDIEKLSLASTLNHSEEKVELFATIKRLPIVLCQNSTTGEQFFAKPGEAYIHSKELSDYFNNTTCVSFISSEYSLKLQEKMEELNRFFKFLGCEDKPRRIPITSNLTNEEKELLREKGYGSRISYEFYTHDFYLEGLDEFLKSITLDGSVVFWNWLLASLQSFEPNDKTLFFFGEYKWNYYTAYTQKFEARFLKTLKTSKWLFDNNKNLSFPHEISISTLSDRYKKNEKYVDILIDTLGFQTDDIQRIEEKTGKKVILMDDQEYQEYLAMKKEKVDEDKDKIVESWKPETEPENISVKAEILYPEYINTQDLRNQSQTNHTDDTKEGENQDQKKNEININKHQLKEIGNWGERFVYKNLLEEYSQAPNVKITWLNKNGNIGKGYDFVVAADAKEIEYIEVKTKLDDEKQYIEITGTQWEFARKLNDEKEGEKYKIYIVSNAGTTKAKISIVSNPVKLWHEGRLYAHPVNIKF